MGVVARVFVGTLLVGVPVAGFAQQGWAPGSEITGQSVSVETAGVTELFENPQADYTKRLLSFRPPAITEPVRERVCAQVGWRLHDRQPARDVGRLRRTSDR